jgi:putative endonuclease
MAEAPQWHVYMIRCGDGALYTGIATDVSRRLAEHREGKSKGARYLRGRGPLQLVLEKVIGDRGLALRVEARIKGLPRAAKQRLIRREEILEGLVTQAQQARSVDTDPARIP